MEQLATKYELPTEAKTIQLGARLAKMARAGDVLCLKGDLGSGKSVLARAFVRALCGADTDVPSPTYTLVQHYDAPAFSIVHADLYRLKDPEEIIEIGLEEGLADAVTLIEWPEHLGRFLPASRLELGLLINVDSSRTACLVGHGSCWENRLER